MLIRTNFKAEKRRPQPSCNGTVLLAGCTRMPGPTGSCEFLNSPGPVPLTLLNLWPLQPSSPTVRHPRGLSPMCSGTRARPPGATAASWLCSALALPVVTAPWEQWCSPQSTVPWGFHRAPHSLQASPYSWSYSVLHGEKMRELSPDQLRAAPVTWALRWNRRETVYSDDAYHPSTSPRHLMRDCRKSTSTPPLFSCPLAPGPHEATLSLLLQAKPGSLYGYPLLPRPRVDSAKPTLLSVHEVVWFAELLTTRELKAWRWPEASAGAGAGPEPSAGVDDQHENNLHDGSPRSRWKNCPVGAYYLLQHDCLERNGAEENEKAEAIWPSRQPCISWEDGIHLCGFNTPWRFSLQPPVPQGQEKAEGCGIQTHPPRTWTSEETGRQQTWAVTQLSVQTQLLRFNDQDLQVRRPVFFCSPPLPFYLKQDLQSFIPESRTSRSWKRPSLDLKGSSRTSSPRSVRWRTGASPPKCTASGATSRAETWTLRLPGMSACKGPATAQVVSALVSGPGVRGVFDLKRKLRGYSIPLPLSSKSFLLANR